MFDIVDSFDSEATNPERLEFSHVIAAKVKTIFEKVFTGVRK